MEDRSRVLDHIYSGNFRYNGWLLVFISSNAKAFANLLELLDNIIGYR